MDQERFDDFARRIATGVSRRTILAQSINVLLVTVASVLAADGAGARAAGITACNPVGTRCGRKKQPSCNTCCTDFASRQRNGQRRCACKPDGRTCNRNDQCCSGLCCDSGGDRICIPGLFGCNGRCPEACSGG